MFKKLQLFCLTLLSSFAVNAQVTPLLQTSCGTQAPPQQWENWLGKEIEKYKQAKMANRTQQVNYTIPVIVHVIHYGEAEGTFPNIDSLEIISQINVLNNDFAGVGLNSNAIPAPFAGVFAGNTGIKFCLAQKNPTGGVLTERGVDRIDASLNTWDNPTTPTVNIVNYINTVVKPATIWDPTKYLNIWISDKPPATQLHGFSTYPAGTSLTGLFGGYGLGGTTDDGIWCWTSAFGTIGNVAPIDKGRTMTHEVGHWLGLRHTWGDGNCLSDYCDDTPPAKTPNAGCLTYPANIDRCGVNQAPYGEMFMNFMDATNDACKSMFTVDQSIRMLTAMSQCPNRNLLGTHDLCAAYSAPSSSAIPSFTLNDGDMPCVGRPFTPMNTSSGFPAPTYIWSSTPPAGFSPNPTVANPAITFNTPGSYTLTLVATNTVSNASFTMAINSVSNCARVQLCIDSIRVIKSIDTLATYNANNSSIVAGCLNGFAGFMTGNNCYKDKEYAQFYHPNSYSATPYPQVNSVIVLFDSIGTKQGPNLGSKVTCKIYGGTINNGPVSALATKQDSMAYIIATTKTNTIHYIGTPNYTFTVARIIPYKFNFTTPVIINSPNTGFFAAVEVPSLYPGDSIKIFTNKLLNTSNDSSSWALTYNSVWRPLRSYRSAKVQLAIIPQITCSPIVGIKEEKMTSFNSNVTLVPNPSSGVFNIIFTLPKEEELYVRIYNSVGQEISSDHLQGVTNNIINIDMNGKPDGIYFTEISNGSERVVKKIIINH